MPAPTFCADPEAGTSSAAHVAAFGAVDVDPEAEALGGLVRPQHADLVAGHRGDDGDVVGADARRERDRAALQSEYGESL